MSEHFVTTCPQCADVWSQCRCISADKDQISQTCPKCLKKGASMNHCPVCGNYYDRRIDSIYYHHDGAYCIHDSPTIANVDATPGAEITFDRPNIIGDCCRAHAAHLRKSLRDEMAMAALATMNEALAPMGEAWYVNVGQVAYRIADAMMIEREKGREVE